MSREDSKALWLHAQQTLERIQSGEITADTAQVQRLQSLLEGQEAWAAMDAGQKRGMIGLLYEYHLYLHKLRSLERFGIDNRWDHPLFVDVRRILYEESDEFRLESPTGS
jgi:hypothetical protein